MAPVGHVALVVRRPAPLVRVEVLLERVDQYRANVELLLNSLQRTNKDLVLIIYLLFRGCSFVLSRLEVLLHCVESLVQLLYLTLKTRVALGAGVNLVEHKFLPGLLIHFLFSAVYRQVFLVREHHPGTNQLDLHVLERLHVGLRKLVLARLFVRVGNRTQVVDQV